VRQSPARRAEVVIDGREPRLLLTVLVGHDRLDAIPFIASDSVSVPLRGRLQVIRPVGASGSFYRRRDIESGVSTPPLTMSSSAAGRR
jgi:hypothetical protein